MYSKVPEIHIGKKFTINCKKAIKACHTHYQQVKGTQPQNAYADYLSPTLLLVNPRFGSLEQPKDKQVWYVINLAHILGQGAFGSVHPAYRVEADKISHLSFKMAVKKIAQTHYDPLEYEATKKYITSYKPFCLNQHYYCFMEYLEGQDLTDQYGTLKPCFKKLKPQQRLAMVVQMVTQVQNMQHNTITTGRGRIHYDIKGQNMRVNLHSGTGEPNLRLIDFGLSQIIPNDPKKQLFASNVSRGQYSLYMPREAYDSQACKGSDVYNLVLPICACFGVDTPYAAKIFYENQLFKTTKRPSESQRLAIYDMEYSPEFGKIFKIKNHIKGVDVRELCIKFLKLMYSKSYKSRPCIDRVVLFFTSLYQYVLASMSKTDHAEEIIYKSICKMIYASYGSYEQIFGSHSTSEVLNTDLGAQQHFNHFAFNKAIIILYIALMKQEKQDDLHEMLKFYGNKQVRSLFYFWHIFDNTLTELLLQHKKLLKPLKKIRAYYQDFFSKYPAAVNSINFKTLLTALKNAIPKKYPAIEVGQFIDIWSWVENACSTLNSQPTKEQQTTSYNAIFSVIHFLEDVFSRYTPQAVPKKILTSLTEVFSIQESDVDQVATSTISPIPSERELRFSMLNTLHRSVKQVSTLDCSRQCKNALVKWHYLQLDIWSGDQMLTA